MEIESNKEALFDMPSLEVSKVVVEYPLPAAKQTHEMVLVGDNMLVLSQQTNSSLVKVALDPEKGRPSAAAKFTIESPFSGLHGLFASREFPGDVWATLQFKSVLIRLLPFPNDIHLPPKVVQRIKLPSSVRGPHVVVENGDHLWTTCKDSGHVVRVNHRRPSDFSIYECSRRPIFVALHPTSGDVYASLDQSSKIFRLVPSSGITSEIQIPTQMGSTPVGLLAGPDGNVWFVLLGSSSGGTGTFGRISSSGNITWFQLTTTAGERAGLIHLAFDKQSDGSSLRLWLLSSSMASQESMNGIFTVTLEGDPLQIVSQATITLPTPYCMTHRILPHNGGLFVTELGVSVVAHVTGAATTNVIAGMKEGSNEMPQGTLNDVPSETSDVYSLFGLGRCIDHFKYSDEHVSNTSVALVESNSEARTKKRLRSSAISPA